ncbi:Extracellular exo-alpha-(1-_5)-L-arabinofuranosidase, partial [Orchesella cincta]
GFIIFSSMVCMLVSTANSQLTFSNPIIDQLSADPCVLKLGDHYYLTVSEKGESEIRIFKSPILTSFRNAESKVMYTATPEHRDLWASELHEVDGELYLYFTMRTCKDDTPDQCDNHRMHVLKAENASDPMGNWSAPQRLLPDWDFAAIDGTILRQNGQKYFVWTSGRVGGLSIYIAPMANATLIERPIVLLSQPTEDWECVGGCVNEGPFFIYNRNVSYMIYSCSSGDNYALSQMSIAAGKDPMDPMNWDSVDGTLFGRNDEEDVLGRGMLHLTETWMVYHGTTNSTGRTTRIARIEKIEWDENGPKFPIAHGYNHPQPVPSGQTEFSCSLLQTKPERSIKQISFMLCMLLSAVNSQLTFSNPIIDQLSADPAVHRVGDNYYLTISENGETELTIHKSKLLTNFRNAEKKVALKITPPAATDLWASEMHEVDGELYIYFTMNVPPIGHNMHAIKAENASDPMGNWSEPMIMLTENWPDGGIDGTIMKHNGKLYFLWTSGRVGRLSMYIAPMTNATYVARPIVLLRMPTEDWECNDGCLNEGAYFIYNNNVSYCVFSGSSTWDPNYSLSYISIPFDKDPLDPDNWDYVGGPVFTRNDEEDVYNTGHAAFTVSPDLTETWMVYHAVANSTGRDRRIARIEKIEWNEDGSPKFPRPHGYNHPQPVPSGQTEV